jgi:hypothetical protein
MNYSIKWESRMATDLVDDIVRAALDWRKYAEPGPVPVFAPLAMFITSKYKLMQAVDAYVAHEASGPDPEPWLTPQEGAPPLRPGHDLFVNMDPA